MLRYTRSSIARQAAVLVVFTALAAVPWSQDAAAAPGRACERAPAPTRCDDLHQYVTTSLGFGHTSNEAAANGFDLDGNGITDNALGALFAGLSGVLDVDAEIARSIASGETVVLHSLRADTLKTDPTASWRTFIGEPDPSGAGGFEVDASAPPGSPLLGSVFKTRFFGGPGLVPLRLALAPDGPSTELHVLSAHVAVNCDPDACTHGKVGGAISSAEADGEVVPALASLMQAVVDEGCPGDVLDSCTPQALTILNIFDANHDVLITADELRASPLIQALLAPDVDVLRADGSPGQDGVKESVSIGLGFAAQAATFDEPAPG